MPTKNGVGRDERSDFGEDLSVDCLASNGQSTSLIVCQAESSATKLLLQDTVLLAEILDDRILLAANPASHGGNEVRLSIRTQRDSAGAGVATGKALY